MGSIGRILDAIAPAFSRAGGVVIVLMMAHITADVAAKALFASPIHGTLEITAVYYMVALVFLPLAHVTAGEGHIKVELFTQKLPRRPMLALETFIALVGAFYVGAMAIGSIDEALFRTMIKDTLETAEGTLEVWPSRWIVPVGTGAMALYLIYEACRTGRSVLSDPKDTL